MIVVLTGVSGSGKSTVGRALAERLGWSFVEGDDFHPPANVRKMESGSPLTEEDREPWLAALRSEVARRIVRGEDAVVTCSCLRARHRSRLRTAGPAVRVVHLGIDPETAEERVSSRGGHYFGAPLVESQFEALEEPEHARVIDARRPVEEIVEEIVAAEDPDPAE